MRFFTVTGFSEWKTLPISLMTGNQATRYPMKAFVSFVLAAVLAFGAPGVLAQQCDETSRDEAQSTDAAPLAQRPDQILYKGVVGNLLEAVPMDPAQRVELQRGNAVISAPLSARSLALLLGITNPVVLVGGLIWGIWAASRIEAPAVHAKAVDEPARAQLAAEAAAGE